MRRRPGRVADEHPARRSVSRSRHSHLRQSSRSNLLTVCLLAVLAVLLASCTSSDPGVANPATPRTGSDGKATMPSATRQPWIAAGIGRLGVISYEPPTEAVYVAPAAARSRADGSRNRPWPSLQQAVNVASDGSTIVLRGGSYHESVSWSGKRLTLQPFRREHVWLTGSRRVGGWLRDATGWRANGWTHTFDREPAFDALDDRHPLAAWPEMVFLDGRALRQVADVTDVAPGTFYVDLERQALVIGSDPLGATVEASTLERALTIRDAAGSVVRGIGVRRYATPFDKVAAIAGFSDQLTFDRLISEDNATNGLSVIGTGCRVLRSTARRNGQIGLHAHKVAGLSVRGNWLQRNNVEGFRWNFAQGGMKITRGTDMVWEANLVDENNGDGMWCDIGCTDVRIVRNVIVGNAGRGVKYEISAGGVIASNRVTDNAGGILVNESSEVLIYNNVISGTRIGILALEGERFSTNPAVPRDLLGVVLRNNIVGSRTAEKPLVAVRGTDRATPTSGRIDADFDVYVVPAGSPPSTLVELPPLNGTSVARENSLEALRAATAQEANGRRVTDAAAAVRGSTPGAALPAAVAAAVGLEPGAQVRPGILGEVPPREVLAGR